MMLADSQNTGGNGRLSDVHVHSTRQSIYNDKLHSFGPVQV